MTSGPARPKGWRLVFERRTAPVIEPLMGYTGRGDTLTFRVASDNRRHGYRSEHPHWERTISSAKERPKSAVGGFVVGT
ncbi:ETC complex I subunit [Mesorhizobium australicum]